MHFFTERQEEEEEHLEKRKGRKALSIVKKTKTPTDEKHPLESIHSLSFFFLSLSFLFFLSFLFLLDREGVVGVREAS